MMLGLVMVLTRLAEKPQTWHWLWAGAGQPGAPSQAGSNASKSGNPADIDTRLHPTIPAEPVAGEFVSPTRSDSPPLPSRDYFPSVRPELLDAVRDDTVFRAAENQAFFHLFGVLNQTDDATLQAASKGQLAFVQLFQQSAEHRGELVSIRGTVRRCHLVSAAANDFGIQNYYQTWIQMYDNPTAPAVAYVLQLPAGFPTGMNLREEVELTGFYFKRWAYKAEIGINTAPLLLARTVRWERPVVAATSPPGAWTVAGIVGGATTVAAVVVGLMLSRGRPTRRSVRPQEVAIGPPPDSATEA